MHNNQSAAAERRVSMRFNKAFRIIIASELFGEMEAVARNISVGGMCVEMYDPLPLGAQITIHFEIPDSCGQVSVQAEVKHQYCFNVHTAGEPIAQRGIGVRFSEFLSDSDFGWDELFYRFRTLH